MIVLVVLVVNLAVEVEVVLVVVIVYVGGAVAIVRNVVYLGLILEWKCLACFSVSPIYNRFAVLVVDLVVVELKVVVSGRQ